MKYRRTVHNALMRDNYNSADYIRELILIGVKLALKEAAEQVQDLKCELRIRAIRPRSLLLNTKAKPEVGK